MAIKILLAFAILLFLIGAIIAWMGGATVLCVLCAGLAIATLAKII